MNKSIKITASILLLIALANIIVSYLTEASFSLSLFNSDALYLPTLFSDLLSKSGSIKDWYLTPAPYFFPDYPLFYFAHILGSDSYSRILIFSLIQVLVTFLVIWLTTHPIQGSKAFLTTTTITIGLIWLALSGQASPFTYFFASAFHYGIFISAAIVAAIWVRHEAEGQKKKTLWTLLSISIIAFLSALSDNLFIIQVAAPFTASIIFLDIASRKLCLKRTLLSAIPLIASVLGSMSYKLIITNHTRYKATLGFGKISHNLTQAYKILHRTINDHPIYGLFLLIYSGFIIYLGLKTLKRSPDNRSSSQVTWLATFSLLSICSSITALLLIQSENIIITDRYLIPVFFWPVIISIILLSYYPRNRHLAINMSLSIAATITMSAHSYGLLTKHGLHQEFYPEEIECIDNALERAGASSGIAQYWDAKFLQNFSRLNLNIAQHYDELGEMNWITSKKYFKHAYDFAIISENAPPPYKISAKTLIKTSGQPLEIVTCGSRSVYIYKKNQLNLKKIRLIGDSYRWDGCNLPTLIGQSSDDCEMTKKTLSQSGFLTFGPYESLPSGKYSFEIAYSSIENPKSAVGAWDVGLALSNKIEILQNGEIHGSASKKQSITGVFTIKEAFHMEKVEVRTIAHKNMDLTIAYITIKKLE